MFVSHLECGLCGTRLPPEPSAAGPATVCPAPGCGKPLLVRYDLDAARAALQERDWSHRPPGLWRYRELLPLPRGAEPVTLGEIETPLSAAPRTAEAAGLSPGRLWLKDEGRLPTGSFKARGMSAALSMARTAGVRRIGLPSAGNAAGAASAYGAAAGMAVEVFVPPDAPAANLAECRLYGAAVHLVPGTIADAGREVLRRAAAEGWFVPATLREPYRIEGKKTMGLELADQFARALAGGRGAVPDRCLPDVIVYPTGGGTGLIGLHKAFAELRALAGRWDARPVGGGVQPRLYAAQPEGCSPVVRAWSEGARFARPFENPATAASGLRVPAALGDFLMIDALRDSGGAAVLGAEADIRAWMLRAGADGLSVCPETAIALSGLQRLVADGRVRPDETVVVLNCATGLKYLDLLGR